MEEEIKILKQKGKTWKQIAQALNISVSTARRYHKKEAKFPRIHEGRIYRRVINPRMILVQIGEEVVPAVIRPGLNYPQYQEVKVEQVDEQHYRVV